MFTEHGAAFNDLHELLRKNKLVKPIPSITSLVPTFAEHWSELLKKLLSDTLDEVVRAEGYVRAQLAVHLDFSRNIFKWARDLAAGLLVESMVPGLADITIFVTQREVPVDHYRSHAAFLLASNDVLGNFKIVVMDTAVRTVTLLSLVAQACPDRLRLAQHDALLKDQVDAAKAHTDALRSLGMARADTAASGRQHAAGLKVGGGGGSNVTAQIDPKHDDFKAEFTNKEEKRCVYLARSLYFKDGIGCRSRGCGKNHTMTRAAAVAWYDSWLESKGMDKPVVK